MPLGRSTDLSVDISGDSTGLDRALKSAETATHRAQTATQRYDADLRKLESDLMKLEKSLDDEVTAALQRQHDAMDKTGRGAVLFGAALAGALALAGREAMQWESAWTGVTKTVDGSEAEMAQLEEDLRALAKTLPATHEEIAGVAEAAGQLGVKREAIVGFTKTMIDLSETTNLTADEAASNMARFANIMQTPQEEVDRLGASLVALGNDGASTEAEILEMAMRIAGAGAQLGLTEGEVLAVANALSSVGIAAEAGGSAISRQLIDMQMEVQDGGEFLEIYARTAGMAADEFARLFQIDAAGALEAFTSGLGRISASGGDVLGVLNSLEITEIRQRDAILRLAGAGDLLGESLQLGNEAWEENSALLEEATKRYATTEAQVQIAGNVLRDSAIDIGSTVLPMIANLADFVANLTTAWGDLPAPLRTATTVLGVAAAAVSLLGGTALIAIPKIAAFKAAVAGLEAGALKTAGTRLTGMAGVLAGPWGLAIGAGITALGIFAAQHGETARKVDEVRQTLDEQTGAITENTREWAKKELLESGALKAAQQLGLDLQLVTDAALGEADAIAAVNEQLDPFLNAQTQLSSEAAVGVKNFLGFVDDSTQAADTIASAVGRTQGVLSDAASEQSLLAAAGKDTADSASAVADAQAGTTDAWADGADAASELTEEVKTLGEQLGDLSENYLSNRGAGRAVRSSLRDIRKELRDYRKEHGDLGGAFKEGTKSGDEFAGMLDGLAQDYIRQIETVERLTGSQKQTMETYRESRRALVDMADQLGMTRQEAQDYAEEVLGTPKMIRTLFQADTDGAKADLRELEALMAQAARDRQARIDVAVHYSDLGFQPRGGLQERAGGGPVTKGMPYWVGEKEAELFVPGQSGQILNQRQLAAALSRGPAALMNVRQGTGGPSGGLSSAGLGEALTRAVAAGVSAREQGPLIGNLTVPTSPGATPHQVVSEVVYELRRVQRSSRWD